ncbi:unnamed protein product, partial [Chrysoparadoxa australica]
MKGLWELDRVREDEMESAAQEGGAAEAKSPLAPEDGEDKVDTAAMEACNGEKEVVVAQTETESNAMEVDSGSSTSWFEFPAAASLEPMGVLHNSFEQCQDERFDCSFVKSLHMAPDGTCLLSSAEDCVMRLHEIGTEAADSVSGTSGNKDNWQPCLNFQEGESIYGAAWYPRMSSQSPETCVFISTSRDHPLHLWDAYTGKLRASYRGYDHLDEVVAANSVCFNAPGDKIFAGYNRLLRVFDAGQPGRNCEERPTSSSRNCKDGQRGIISSLAFSPDFSGLFAAGSYGKSVCLYDERMHSACLMVLWREGMGGVTHMKFSPDGRLLYSGGRKEDSIACWDIRGGGGALLRSFERMGDTNQKLSFDVDASGKYLAAGGTDGKVAIYSTVSGDEVGHLEQQPDAVGAVCFHPTSTVMALCTGQRHYNRPAEVDSDDDLEEDE